MLGKINFWAVAGIGDPRPAPCRRLVLAGITDPGYSFFGKVSVTVVPRFISLSILADPP
jgi:hypothetical protein